jgi:CxxC-x17-CxxC domain-containing protein
MYGGNSRGNSYGRPRNDGPREMHNVKCSDCGAETQVPFKPTEGRPVYCRDCFQKHKPKDRF